MPYGTTVKFRALDIFLYFYIIKYCYAESVTDQTELIWRDTNEIGWVSGTAYRWQLIHRPEIGLMRIRIYNNVNVIIDSGNQYNFALNGGRLGVYCFSQVRYTILPKIMQHKLS